MVDSFDEFSASALAAVTMARSIGGAVVPLIGPLLYEQLEQGWGNSVLALIMLACSGIPVLMYIYGARWRAMFTTDDLQSLWLDFVIAEENNLLSSIRWRFICQLSRQRCSSEFNSVPKMKQSRKKLKTSSQSHVSIQLGYCWCQIRHFSALALMDILMCVREHCLVLRGLIRR